MKSYGKLVSARLDLIDTTIIEIINHENNLTNQPAMQISKTHKQS